MLNCLTIQISEKKLFKNPSWEAEVYDVETVFFNGNLEEPIYMKIPKRMDYLVDDYNPETDCFLLTKAVYGLVQAVKKWWKKFIFMLSEEFGFTRSHADVFLVF